MDIVALEVQKRDTSASTAEEVRSSGLIPGECYGAGKDNVSIQIDYQTFRKVYAQAGENTVIDLTVGKDTHKVLVHDVQIDPLHSFFTHVDFKFINMNNPVTTNIPVTFEGTAPAVKDDGGILTTNLTEIEVKCLPADIPHEFIVDISPLVDFHTVIHVSDLTAPEGVEILSDPEVTIASVSAPRVAEEDATSTADEEAAAIAELAGEEAGEGEEASSEEGE